MGKTQALIKRKVNLGSGRNTENCEISVFFSVIPKFLLLLVYFLRYLAYPFNFASAELPSLLQGAPVQGYTHFQQGCMSREHQQQDLRAAT